MKLRTVINELACTAHRQTRLELLDADVLLTPEYDVSAPSDMLLVRLCRLEDWEAGSVRPDEGQVLLVHVGAKMPEGLSLTGDVVAVAHPSSYDDLRAIFLDMPSRVAVLELLRERMFHAFLGSYDLAQFARKSSEVLGNPVIITNADQRLLASAGDFPADAEDVQEVLRQGYLSEEVSSCLLADGLIDMVRHARHSVLSAVPRYGRHWVTSMVYYHHLELGRFDVMEKDRSITGLDLELIDYAGSLAGIMIDRLGAAGERVGAGSSVLSDLISGSFANEKTMLAQLSVTHLPLDVSYVLMALSGQVGADRAYLSKVGGIVARSVRDCLWCVADDVLAVLVPVGKSEAVGFDDYARAARRLSGNAQLTSVLENNGLRAFVSEPFSDLTQAKARFGQCRVLVEAAAAGRVGAGAVPGEGGAAGGPGASGGAAGTPVRPDPSARIAFFWEHRFATLAATAASADQVDMMLDKRVVAMAAYDRAHQTSYLETAIMSVRYPGSPAEAAAALNVHRNTYFYRMNKVKELFYLDLKDGDDRLALSFSAQVMAGMAELPRA